VSEDDVLDDRRGKPARHLQQVREQNRPQSATDSEQRAEPAIRLCRRRRPTSSPRSVNSGSPRQPISSTHFDSGDKNYTLYDRDVNDDGVTWGPEERTERVRRPCRRRRPTSSPRSVDSGSPRQPIASTHFDSGDKASALYEREANDVRVTWGPEEKAEPVRRPRRRRRTSPRSVNSGSPRQQPQPITSIHFDSGEIDSTICDRDTGNDRVTWGLDADRCLFETTFPVRDQRRATRRTTLQLPKDDEDYNISDDELREKDDRSPRRHQPTRGLSRWSTLDDLHYSSLDSVAAAAADDDASGESDRSTSPTRKRRASPAHMHRPASIMRRRAVSLPNRAVKGFFVDCSDRDTENESYDEDTEDDYRRRRRRDDGSGDRRSRGHSSEFGYDVEYGSDDWLEMKHEIYRRNSRAEKLFDFPSQATFLPPTSMVLAPLNQQPRPIPVLTTSAAATQTVPTIKKNETQQQSLQQSSVPTQNPASKERPADGESKPDQVAYSSLSDSETRIQILLLVAFIAILLGGFIYKHAWSPTQIILSPPRPQETPQNEATPLTPNFVDTYFADVVD